MRISVLILSILMLSASVFAEGLSAARGSHESYDQARVRSLMNYQWSNIDTQADADSYFRRTPTDVKVNLENLDTSSIPELPSYEVLESEFKYVRDARFLKTDDPQFDRRLTWLYPDDGCYVRAEMVKIKLVEHHQAAPKKIFVFGNLSAATRNTFSGRIEWWYHVAATYRVAETVYVFDPAIEPERPLTLDEWNLAVGGNQTPVKYAVCAPNAFDPNSNCENPRETSINNAYMEQRGFLSPEWERLLRLNRDPKKELGEFPPWLH